MASVAKRKWTHKGSTKEAWVVRYKDKGGAHRSRQFVGKKDADGYKRKVENEIEAGTHVARSQSVTIRQLMDEYLDWCDGRTKRGDLSAARLRYLVIVRRRIVRDLGNNLLLELQWQQVERFGNGLRTEMAVKSGKPLSLAFIKGTIDTLHSAVAFGERRGYVARNVVRLARTEIGNLKGPRIDSFTRDEVQRILIALETKQPHCHTRVHAFMRCAVYLGAFCALRRGEIMALKWESIDFERGLLHVTNSLAMVEDAVKEPKTASGKRSVPLPPVVAAALHHWRRYCVTDDRGLIFRAKKGTRWPNSPFYNAWWAIQKRAGLEPGADSGWRHFHALRHFAGSAWLDLGMPLPAVSKLMGHAHPGITAEIYSHVLSDDPMARAEQITACANALVRPPIAQQLRIAA
jgi:integrase